MSVVLGFLAPGKPQLILSPEANPGWQRLHDSFIAARKQLEDSGAEMLLIYSTQWHSIIGHQMQADPNPRWSKVDDDFHDLEHRNNWYILKFNRVVFLIGCFNTLYIKLFYNH